jgi:hypothetical protein
MSAVHGVIVSEAADRHRTTAEWWWSGCVPDGVIIDRWFEESRKSTNETK